MKAVISSTGLWTPTDSISNEELVESYNAYADKWNAENAAEIEAGTKDALTHSDAGFIEKASGVKARYVCLLYTSPSPRDRQKSRMPSSA